MFLIYVSYSYCDSCDSSLVSLEVFPQDKSCWIVQTTAIRHSIFISPLFLCLSIYNFKISCYLFLLFFPVLSCYLSFSSYSFLLFFLFLVLFCPSVYSLYFLISLAYGFLFKSVILSFVFSCYFVMSASPLCSVPIQSVLFLLVFILLDTSI